MRKLPTKPLMVGAAILYTSCSMYAGDVMDVKSGMQGIKDNITGTTTSEGFAPRKSVEVVTRVNERGQRETYLRFERSQETVIDDKGYAIPRTAESILNYLQSSRLR